MALKNGLDANIKSMSQMEKTMLRYQYVLSNMAIVNGDFQRTVGTWANQTRILGQNFESLGSVIGGTLINVFKPFVAGLNVVMENVIAFSKTVANALGAIFGWTIEMEAGGLANDFYDAADAADALADGTGDAADNAKKTQKTLSVLPFDELNQLTKESEKTGKNGGSGSNDAASGDALANAANLIKTDSLIEKYKSEIDNLYKLGKYIGDTLTDAMNGINWESAYESARNFGTGLADFLNGLISPELFGALGRTIAGSLNIAINAVLSFGETFDWKDLGLSIAEGVNEFFDKFSFSDLAKTINTWAHGIFDMMLTAMRNIKWANIGTEIGNFLSDVDFIGIAKKMAQLFWERVNAAFALYSNMFTAAPIETALLTVFAAPRLMKHLSPGIQSFCKSAGKIFSSSFSAATSAFNTTMATAGSTVFASLTAAGQGFIGKFKSGLKELSPVMKGVFSAATALGEFKLIEDGIQRLDDGVGGFIAGIGEIGGAVAIAGGIFTSMFGVPVGVIATAVVGLVGVFSGLKKAIEESFNESPTGQFVNAIDALAQDVTDKSESIREDIQNTINSVSDAADAETARARDLAGEYENLASKSNLTTGEKQRLKDISNDLVDIIPELQGYIDDETGALEIQSDTLSTIIDKYDSLARANAAQEALTDAYKEQYSAQMNLNDAVSKYQEYAEDFIASQGDMNDSIKNLILEGDIQGLYDYRDAVRETAGSYGEMRDKFMGMSVTGFTEWIISLEDSTKDYREALDDANETLDESGEAVDYLRGVLEEQEEASRKASDALREQWKASSEGKQTLSDLTTDLESLGLSLKESFVEDLAFEDFDSSSLKRFFKSIQDGVAQSSADIKGAFEEVGLSIPDDLADAIESKSPEVQGRAIKLLMNIKSGVQGNSEDIKKVFGSLGMELPDALIDNLASKESSVQSKTIELLSKMEVGHSLSEENLTSMFANIGLRVPGALIESLSSQKAEVQYQALDLLGQIGTASGAKKQELIDDLNQFGVDVTQAGLVTAISGQQESVSGVTLQMLSEGMGGAFAKMNPVLSQTAKDTGEKVSTSIADGVSSKTSDATSAVTDVTSEMAKTANSNLGISGSESKVFKDAGETSGQSLATGFKSQSGIIGQNVFDMVSGATGKLQGMDQTFSDSGVKSSNALGKAFSGNKMAVISIVSDLKKGLISTFDGMSTKFNELGRQMSTSLSNGISEGSGAAVNVLSGLMRNLSGMGGQMYNVGRDVAQQFAYGFSSVHIPTPHWDIRYQYMTVGNQKVAIPNINVNWYKTGGLFGSPAVIGIGEAGEEAVLPLENRKTMKRIADAILENSSGINEEKLAQTISSSVALAMNMSSMNQRGTEYMQNNIYLDGRVMARAVTKAQEKKDYISNPSGKL